MQTFFKAFLFLFLLFPIVGQLSCKSEKSPPPFDLDNKKFHSMAKPGKWKNLADSHIPACIVIQGKSHKIISVTIPFGGTVSPVHYIEAIILLDHNRKELQKVTFKAGSIQAKVEFKLPSNYKSFVYVVSKCNLHDMWEKKVFFY